MPGTVPAHRYLPPPPGTPAPSLPRHQARPQAWCWAQVRPRPHTAGWAPSWSRRRSRQSERTAGSSETHTGLWECLTSSERSWCEVRLRQNTGSLAPMRDYKMNANVAMFRCVFVTMSLCVCTVPCLDSAEPSRTARPEGIPGPALTISGPDSCCLYWDHSTTGEGPVN